LDWIIDLVCLFVFTGLVAFKMQMIKNYANQYGTSEPKMAVWMALSMYITFINLFMTILRLMSRR
ncbi:MAG TPA: Bax inhibitor-1 family protein, partial [Bacteroidia bacterium]|nr:Bax inhibitor-1 family protein [Bacteroidia bacterium]